MALENHDDVLWAPTFELILMNFVVDAGDQRLYAVFSINGGEVVEADVLRLVNGARYDPQSVVSTIIITP